MNPHGKHGGSSNAFPMDPLVPCSFNTHFLSHIVSFVDNSRYLYVHGSLVLQETFSCFSKVAGALVIWFARGSNFNVGHKILGKQIGSNPSYCKCDNQLKHTTSQGQKFKGIFDNCRCDVKLGMHSILGKISSFSMKRFYMEAEKLCSFPVFSLAAALVPPFNNL